MVKEQAQLHLDNNIDNHNSVRTWRLKLIRRKKMVKGYLHRQKTKCKTAYNWNIFFDGTVTWWVHWWERASAHVEYFFFSAKYADARLLKPSNCAFSCISSLIFPLLFSFYAKVADLFTFKTINYNETLLKATNINYFNFINKFVFTVYANQAIPSMLVNCVIHGLICKKSNREYKTPSTRRRL